MLLFTCKELKDHQNKNKKKIYFKVKNKSYFANNLYKNREVVDIEYRFSCFDRYSSDIFYNLKSLLQK